MATQEPGWSSLPADLLITILDLLPWSSHPRFAAVCKNWRRSVVSPFYPVWLTPLLLNVVDMGSTNLRYYSPYHHKIFEVITGDKLEIPNAKICCTSGQYLTVCQRADMEITVVNINLVTGVTNYLFSLERTRFDFVIYDGKSRMYGIRGSSLEIARAIQSDSGGWHQWKYSEFSPDEWLVASPMTNLVHHRGLLYLLDVDGRLAVYDDCRHEEGLQLLDKPQGFGFDCDDDNVSYLFESDEGELMAVLMGRRGTPVHVLKLNDQEMQWEKVDSLQGRALFTGTATTMMVKTNVKCMQNKIFVPRLYDWPELIHVHLVEKGGELAFVPISTTASVAQYADGTGIWACGLGDQESSEFWETIKLDYSIWVDFNK